MVNVKKKEIIFNVVNNKIYNVKCKTKEEAHDFIDGFFDDKPENEEAEKNVIN